MNLDIGIESKALEEISSTLNRFLANTYALYLKTQNYHWNIRGSDFYSLHLLFEKQYEELAEGCDIIAERIRSLGHKTKASFAFFQNESALNDPLDSPSQADMIADLTRGHELLAKMGRPLISHFQKLLDEVTADMLIQRLTAHEQAAWMLRSHLTETK